MPPCVLTQLKNGGWTVSLTGRTCHSIGIDECHEMCIKSNQRIRIPSFPEKVIIETDILKSIYSSCVSDKKKIDLTIKCQLTKLGSSSLNSERLTILCAIFLTAKS